MIDEKSAEQVENVLTTLGEWGRSFDHQAFEDYHDEYDTDTMVLIHQEVGERILKKVPEIIQLLFPKGMPKRLRDRIYKIK